MRPPRFPKSPTFGGDAFWKNQRFGDVTDRGDGFHVVYLRDTFETDISHVTNLKIHSEFPLEQRKPGCEPFRNNYLPRRFRNGMNETYFLEDIA
jgi:hypothetical protein